MCSITSISPEAGQPTCGKLAPSIQNAGQAPRKAGSFIRASMRPNLKVLSPCVFMRAEV